MAFQKPFLIWLSCIVIAAAQEPAEPGLVIPPQIYVVPGVETHVVLRNAALIPPGKNFEVISCRCEVGELDESGSKWVFNLSEDQTGNYPLVLESNLGSAKTMITVVSGAAGADRDISLLMVGDSLTNASIYPNEVARLLAEPGNPNWKMLGTHQPRRALPGVFHEGYGGWTWNRFNTRWDPGSPQTGKTRSSPFLFLKGGKPQLDWNQYFDQYSDGVKPDFVTFLLGINDCFNADADDPEAIDERIDAVFSEAERLMAVLREASPETEVGICLTPPGNDRDAAFLANYKDGRKRWRWRRIQFRLVDRQISHFSGRKEERIFIVPTSAVIDPITGYEADNGVHPNRQGYESIGREIYAWLKWRLASRPD
ncbi:MAG: SGNH/GDSL hydrolase family protein [Verrucomicrobiales bacterium]|nr:SGNH/GDSL hydrolase family protein [Verrucomicrobiales bacterium]